MQPKVFIIILNWNGKEDTRECIASVKEIDYENYDIIVVDNASTDNSTEYLKDIFPGLCIMTNNDNLGYAGGNNIGINYAMEKGCDFILLLNNDVVVDKNFLKILVNIATGQNNIGIIGPLIYFHETEKINFAGGYINNKTFTPMIMGYKESYSKKFNKIKEVDYVSGACILIKSRLFKEIGLLDKDYFILWEETDFCFRAKKAGFRVLFQPDSFIWHKESVTFKSNETPRYLYYAVRNKLLFLKKNVHNSFFLRLKTALGTIALMIRLFKRYNKNDNFKKAQACFFAIRDYYCRKFERGPVKLYE